VSVYRYETLDGGKVVKGSVTAPSREEAILSLSRMGITPTRMGIAGEELKAWDPPIEAPSKTAPAAAPPKQVVIASADDDDAVIVGEEEIRQEIDVTNKKPQVPIGWPKVPIPEPVKPPEANFMEVRRRQSVLFGPYQNIHGEINRLLSQFGEVKFMNLQPDLRGNIMMAIVIEHDEPLKKEKK